ELLSLRAAPVAADRADNAVRTEQCALLPALPRRTPNLRRLPYRTALPSPTRETAIAAEPGGFALGLFSCHSSPRRRPPLKATRSFDRARIAANSNSNSYPAIAHSQVA